MYEIKLRCYKLKRDLCTLMLFTDKKKHIHVFSDYPAEAVSPGSKYLSLKTLESLNQLFTASQQIQDWLTECAKVRYSNAY